MTGYTIRPPKGACCNAPAFLDCQAAYNRILRQAVDVRIHPARAVYTFTFVQSHNSQSRREPVNPGTDRIAPAAAQISSLSWSRGVMRALHRSATLKVTIAT